MDNSITILGQIILIILGLFSTYIIFNFMRGFERELHHKKYYYVIAYILYTFIIFTLKGLVGEVPNIVITAALTAIIGHFLYNKKRIFVLYYFIYIIVLVSAQIVGNFLFSLICSFLNINFYSNEIYVITLSIIIQLMNFGVSRMFIAIYSKKRIDKITPVQYLNFLLLPIFSILNITTLMMYVQVYLSIQDIILLIANIASIIALNIFITNIFEAISKNNELKNQVVLYEQQSKMQYEYYNTLENKYDSSRKLIHDMKNHLQTIENLYQLQENEKAREYTEDMYKMFDKLNQRHYTRNRVLNIIINDKVQRAESLGISLNCCIDGVDLEFIKDIDLTIVFSNLLDNAIEGIQNINEGKEILLKIIKFNDFIVINISNCIDIAPISEGEEFKSTKKKHSGIGLQNVRMALEKYQGSMRINYDNKIFKVNIVIPIN
ncbi:MAG: hypothetical protein K0R09_602 [Clostridiales bacterium]|nr:hypothetical protein [Clostridiales bacterium]